MKYWQGLMGVLNTYGTNKILMFFTIRISLHILVVLITRFRLTVFSVSVSLIGMFLKFQTEAFVQLRSLILSGSAVRVCVCVFSAAESGIVQNFKKIRYILYRDCLA